MNIAKLTSQDLLLFNGIMSDLFPGVDTPLNDYGKVIFIVEVVWIFQFLSVCFYSIYNMKAERSVIGESFWNNNFDWVKNMLLVG